MKALDKGLLGLAVAGTLLGLGTAGCASPATAQGTVTARLAQAPVTVPWAARLMACPASGPCAWPGQMISRHPQRPLPDRWFLALRFCPSVAMPGRCQQLTARVSPASFASARAGDYVTVTGTTATVTQSVTHF